MLFQIQCSVHSSYMGETCDKPGEILYSEEFFAGIEVVNADNNGVCEIEVDEGEESSILLKPTVPLLCPPNIPASLCKVFISVDINDQRPPTCPDGTQISQCVTERMCGVWIERDTWNNTVSVPIRCRLEKQYDGNREMMVALEVLYFVFNQLWSNYKIRPECKVICKDKEQIDTQHHICQSLNDPHMKTFDKKSYEHHLKGTFVLYQHRDHDVEIQARYRSCGSKVTCNCGVAVRHGDVALVLDRCTNKIMQWNQIDARSNSPGNEVATYFYPISSNLRAPDDNNGLRIVKYSGGKHFQIHLPTGTYVEIKYSRSPLINIWVYPSVNDYTKTDGLCGTFDKDKSNDFTLPDGTLDTSAYQNNRGKWYAPAFSNAWEVEDRDKDLFQLRSLKSTKSDTDLLPYCECTNTGDLDADDHVQLLCDTGRDIALCIPTRGAKEITSQFFNSINSLRVPHILRAKASATGRAAAANEEVTDFTDLASNTTWPVGNWTEALARSECEKNVLSSVPGATCMSDVPGLDYTWEVESCMEDILQTEGLDWVMSSLDSAKSLCIDEIGKNLELWEEDEESGHPVPPQEVEAVICPEECNERGTCANGVCECEDDYLAPDCAISLKEAPSITVDEDVYPCSTASCLTDVVIRGTGMADTPQLTCIFTPLADPLSIVNQPLQLEGNSGQVVSVPGFMVTSEEIRCDLTEGIAKSGRAEVASGPLVLAYRVQVSNMGADYDVKSNSVDFLHYNPACISCDLTGSLETEKCSVKDSTCAIGSPISGRCYQEDQRPSNDSCLVCRPGYNQTYLYNSGNCGDDLLCTDLPTNPTDDADLTGYIVGIVVLVVALVAALVGSGFLLMRRQGYFMTKTRGSAGFDGGRQSFQSIGEVHENRSYAPD